MSGDIVTFKTLLESNQNSLKDKELAFVLNTLEHYQDQSIFHDLWNMIQDHEHNYRNVVEFINQNPAYTHLIQTFLDKKFNLTDVVDILAQINQLLENSPNLIRNRHFQILAIQKTAFAVGNSSDLFKAANTVKAFKVSNPEVDFSKMKDRMIVYTEIVVIDEIEIQNVTLIEIDKFVEFSTGKLDKLDLPNKRILSKYRILKVLHELFHTPVVSVGLVLQQLPPASRKEVRDVLKNILQPNISKQYFQHLLAAFEDEQGYYHYSQLFAFMSKNTDEQIMLSFIKWTATNLQLDHHYYRALKAYLKSHPRSVWKNKNARKELNMISTSNFRKLIKEVESESASPFLKFFKRYGFQLSSALLIILTVASGLYFGYDLLVNKEDKESVSKLNKVAASEKVKVLDIDPFKKWSSEEPFVFNVNGEKQTITFGGINPTGGKSLVLSDGQNSETPFDLELDSEASPFDEKGGLKEGFSLYHTEYDFDNNGNSEVVIMALSQTFESFVWAYSPISENGSVNLRLDLAVKGMSDAKLVNNTLQLLGDQGQSETYAYLNQQFEKQ